MGLLLIVHVLYSPEVSRKLADRRMLAMACP
jgi:hypothetical protein